MLQDIFSDPVSAITFIVMWVFIIPMIQNWWKDKKNNNIKSEITKKDKSNKDKFPYAKNRKRNYQLKMGCFNTLLLLLLGGIYLFWPDLMQVEGFWFSFIAIWLCFFVSWALFGDIADEIAGVNKYKDDQTVCKGD